MSGKTEVEVPPLVPIEILLQLSERAHELGSGEDLAVHAPTVVALVSEILRSRAGRAS